MISCFIFACGVAGQVASHTATGLIIGRLIAGLVLEVFLPIFVIYVSEISPKHIGGLLVSIYQFAIAIGHLTASGATRGTSNLDPVQELEKAADALSRVRGQPVNSPLIQNELAELKASSVYARTTTSWLDRFKNGLKTHTLGLTLGSQDHFHSS
ncbi:hypothetical protein PEBR_31351 [Penicillium brasilianum]|uniref:Major facilitator superfamily (MFS) profile domain-containing protein n=1 Tax=Penicillium brasilianum TaxID=104259 RepID=A0A1S9RI34_PENBI|nr:hypothetical protein PEBR_31351 [Penicillium brasilianum]